MRIVECEVAVIGGGITGAGTLRDCALRGLKAVLIEKNDLASGTTGRNHGLLHSGARYAVQDPESAVECIAENRILKKIAHHCIENTGGLFVTLPDDDPGFHALLLQGCRAAGIECDEISADHARRLEPHLNPDIVAALKVPDGTIDPFRLTSANVLDAVEHGAKVMTHTEVTGLIVDRERIAGFNCLDKRTGEPFELRARVVVNASGVWGQKVCAWAGIDLPMFPSKGSMVIIDYRVNNVVINRCRPPADGDIIVPGDTVSLIGTTSKKIPYDEIEDLVVDDDEIEVLLADGEKLIPNVSRTRVLRAYCGVRPLVAVSGKTFGRDISRGIVLVDHLERDGAEGLVTIAGGKLMTYRLMAEMTADLVCRKLGRKAACSTRSTPLPGSGKKAPLKKTARRFSGIPQSVVGSTHYRHGERAHRFLSRDPKSYGLICECEMVTAGEVTYAVRHLMAKDLIDLRRRTRLGMGPCQGELCAYRAAGLFTELGPAKGDEATRMLIDFLEERFKGLKPVLWGDALRELEFTYWIYQGLFGLTELDRPSESDEAD
ncbi:MAG: anaerobic glycerol-3-phosphate dehydrogenase subunit A [Proteobacteria bacterium]|nr:anaerobic glycerol-3-phosphate dehydrogenase subunit A [Pseudomonadota bacterium]